MARICLMEFKDAARHVTNNVAVAYMDKQTPPEFAQKFPHVGREIYTNGILQFSKSSYPLYRSSDDLYISN